MALSEEQRALFAGIYDEATAQQHERAAASR
jgi:hypothetical protein